MALLDTWRNLAYQTEMDNKTANEFWGSYFTQEKAIYEQILADPDTVVKGTVKELADKYGVEVLLMTGFLDGINDSLKTPNPIETMEEDTEVSLDYDKEKLYYNMVACKADWLYELPQWDNLLDEATRKDLYKKQKLSGTIVKGKKIGRNDPCPCGSGKKYKQCCGKNAKLVINSLSVNLQVVLRLPAGLLNLCELEIIWKHIQDLPMSMMSIWTIYHMTNGKSI